MSSVLDLARPDLRTLRPYQPGEWEPGMTRLNANESPWRLPSDPTARGLNVYPPPRPAELRAALADYYQTSPVNLLVTRGSSEAIDVLIRGFCRAGRDSIVITPPTFDMYRVYATIQAAAIRKAPLIQALAFDFDVNAVLDAVDDSTRIVFICSPNNPTGTVIAPDALATLAEALEGRALVVVDAAYQDYAEDQRLARLLERFEHVVVLRTLSKFVALAGARCGVVIGAPSLIGFLENVLPPYQFPTPSIEIVLEALKPGSLAVARERIAETLAERERLRRGLAALGTVIEVYPSQANFVLARLNDRAAFVAAARAAGILVRVFNGEPALADCVRITVGLPVDNTKLLAALAGAAGARASASAGASIGVDRGDSDG
ncbi:MAG TPA: histidinol-phosphate transaminase [Gammaproteobacteria bacterium]|nr:histidinol-phosphate transaminase [Gammaproteobacteria bacterium]